MVKLEFLLALLAVVAFLAGVARLVRVPYPILVVLGGLAMGFVPGVPEVELEPEVVFLLFLPPLLYAGAFFSSPRDLRANARSISLLAVALVLVTIVAVAAVGRLAVGLDWGVAFVLGAIVSPTDPIAATVIFRRLGVPGRMGTVVEGESLVNDGVGLVAYRLAVVAVATGAFSLPKAALEFVIVAAGGVALGLALGWLVARLRRRLDDPQVEITVSLFTPYAAYIPAEELGVSGILATVTVGLYLGWFSPGLFLPGTRLQAYAFWEVLAFLLNSVLFLLVGLQLPLIVERLPGGTAAAIALGGLVSAVVIAVRLGFQFTMPYFIRALNPSLRRREGPAPWRQRVLLGWSGMRGAISLAAALALPLETAAGTPFPDRDLVIFLTYCVLVATLVGQGLTLTPLIRALGLGEEEGGEPDGEGEARVRAAHAALGRLEELASGESVPDEVQEQLRGVYQQRLDSFEETRTPDGDSESSSEAYQRLRRELIAAERAAAVGMRDEGEIGSDVMRRLERDLDLEESRLEG